MQAVNHVATALILKRKFPSASLLGMIAATEAVEYLWVGLNVIGIEKTVVDDPMRSVADVHLVHMPFSHSLASSAILALAVGLVVLWRGGRAASGIAIAFSLATASHIFLDLLVHAPDIVVSPFFDGKGYGTGLYANVPLLALALETLWGVVCWWVYRGSWVLLVVLVTLEVTAIPFYSAAVNLGETALGGQNTLFASVILVQMLATSVLIWAFARMGPR